MPNLQTSSPLVLQRKQVDLIQSMNRLTDVAGGVVREIFA